MSHAPNNCNAPSVEPSPEQQGQPRALARATGSEIPRPTTMRRVWVPGIQYEGESLEQMEAREKRLREADALADAEEKRLYEWKCRPWWADSFPNS